MINILNYIIAAFAAAVTAFLSLLPTSPFQAISLDSTWLSYINYFIPVASMLTHLSVYLTACAAYYVIRIGLRWVKAIE